ncbi:glutathione synthase [Chryseobacterium sp. B21-037]|uniref:glutathione synthase n=1 Tax=Chryseobacterium sp. B21-037 TaxID=2926038 RepID=UPI0023599969|nr:glutathione synthase [Chryseobacterium sp. B21-037]MDC8104011.1 glutathione synthase [Chryseobacterium sp. B21-037]
MAHRNLHKEDFVPTDDGRYQVEYKKIEIGEGSNLTVEKRNEDGSYEVIQAMIRRLNDRIFISWSEPFEGRLIFEK